MDLFRLLQRDVFPPANGPEVPSRLGPTRERTGAVLRLPAAGVREVNAQVALLPTDESVTLSRQLPAVVLELTRDPASRRATAFLGRPDPETGAETQCLLLVQFLRREGEVLTFAFFRSADVGRKFTADVRVLTAAVAHVAAALGDEVGELTVLVGSAHVYR